MPRNGHCLFVCFLVCRCIEWDRLARKDHGAKGKKWNEGGVKMGIEVVELRREGDEVEVGKEGSV